MVEIKKECEECGGNGHKVEKHKVVLENGDEYCIDDTTSSIKKAVMEAARWVVNYEDELVKIKVKGKTVMTIEEGDEELLEEIWHNEGYKKLKEME